MVEKKIVHLSQINQSYCVFIPISWIRYFKLRKGDSLELVAPDTDTITLRILKKEDYQMPSYDFSDYKNGIEFLIKNHLTFDEAIAVLDFEITRLKKELDRTDDSL